VRVTIAVLAGAWGGASLAALACIAVNMAVPEKIHTVGAVLGLIGVAAALGAAFAGVAVGVAGALRDSRRRITELDR